MCVSGGRKRGLPSPFRSSVMEAVLLAGVTRGSLSRWHGGPQHRLIILLSKYLFDKRTGRQPLGQY